MAASELSAHSDDPSSTCRPIRLSEARILLQHEYLALESGHGLTTDDMYHVAASTFMPGCTTEMIHWWFGWLNTTEQYKIWHPRDHIHLAWDVPRKNDSQYIGGNCFVEEYIGGVREKLVISFKSPRVYFGDDFQNAFTASGYGTAVCARVGTVGETDEQITYIGHLIHLIKEEAEGIRMRSRFWLGDIEGAGSPVGKHVPDHLKKGLSKHCSEEMSFLATSLPNLFKMFAQRV